MFGERGRRQLVQPGTKNRGRRQADLVGRDAAIEHPGARLGNGKGLRQHVMQVEYFDAALAHFQDEVVVILLRFMDPQHVVEQE